MRNIVYYVSISLDGYISGPDGNINGFVPDGSGVDKYLNDLNEFDTVIMGRNTYEFGYRFGLKPGQLAYPHMEHYVFSKKLTFKEKSDKIHVKKIDIEEVHKLRRTQGGDIYLCGGGQFAGWLLEHEQIQFLKIKLQPLILGDGVRLFESTSKFVQTTLLETSKYEKGLQIMKYKIDY